MMEPENVISSTVKQQHGEYSSVVANIKAY